MRLQPKGASRRVRINTDLLPPNRFIAAAMDFAVMSPTEGDRKLVADLAAKCRRLRKL
jgi:hypothetical protein